LTWSPSVEVAAAALGSLARRDVPLGALTTYRVGGNAALFVEATAPTDLQLVAAAIQVSGIAVLVVGRGSNLLVADRGFDGLVVVLGDWSHQIEVDGTLVRAGGGTSLPALARRTVAAGLTGFEWAVGVPGSVGGAVRMNAGGHGADTAASVTRVHVHDLHTGEDGWVNTSALDLRFRGSALADHQVVLGAELALAKGDRASSEALLDEIVRWRRQHQPGGQNAGSVFVNPVPGEVSAGELIDGLGLRGLRIGTAEVSTKHANFIQADPAGASADVVALMAEVRRRVLDAHGYDLRSEVRLVGFSADEIAAASGTAS
jgi:UDP-N-acetylmuramate dehydrogenase